MVIMGYWGNQGPILGFLVSIRTFNGLKGKHEGHLLAFKETSQDRQLQTSTAAWSKWSKRSRKFGPSWIHGGDKQSYGRKGTFQERAEKPKVSAKSPLGSS